MEIIIITGKSGSGKSEISKILAKKLNCPVFFLDEFSHESLEDKNIKSTLIKKFGKTILDNNKINRKILGEIIFSNSVDLEFVNNLSWKYIDDTLDKILEKINSNYVILDYALLPIMKYFKMAKFKILITANKKTRLSRLIKRDKTSLEYLNLRDANSLTYKKSEYDFVLNTTNFSLIELENEAEKIAKKIQI